MWSKGCWWVQQTTTIIYFSPWRHHIRRHNKWKEAWCQQKKEVLCYQHWRPDTDSNQCQPVRPDQPDQRKEVCAANDKNRTTTTDHQWQESTATETKANTDNNHNEVSNGTNWCTFNFHEINSLAERFQMTACIRLNLQLFPAVQSLMSRYRSVY